MLRITIAFFVVVIPVGCIVSSKTLKESQPTNMQLISSIDGVYEFISETTVINVPSQQVDRKTNSEWSGFWFFNNGHFSKTMMKKERPDWLPGKFPAHPLGTGFDAAAGTFKIDADRLRLVYTLSYYPGMAYQEEIMSFSVDADRLILVLKLVPNRESESEGKRTVELIRISDERQP